MYKEYFYNSNINNEKKHLEMNNVDLEMNNVDLEMNNVDFEMNKNKHWSDSLENVLKMWGEKAAGNRELHLNSVRHWKKVSSYFSIPLIFLTTITSVSTFSAVNYEDYEYWMYAAGTVNLIAAFLTSLNKYLKPEEKIQAHYQSARAFGAFYRKIVLEMSLSRTNREPTNILTKWAKNEYDKLIMDSPILPNKIINIYKSLHTNNINTPDIILNDFTIHINRND
tara:strand:+ start:815 stop:1486 length:672 start_codon:yes stop_codon:yes gene_type:complete